MGIVDFVRKVLGSNTNEKEVYSLGKVTAENAEMVLYATNLNIENYERIVDNYAIKHTLEQHGNAAKEKSRGQVALTPNDFACIEQITQMPDKVTEGTKNKQKDTPVVNYEKTINGELYVYLEEIQRGK